MKFNLKKYKASQKDYAHVLGSGPLQDELLFLSPILDQGESAECTAYCGVAVRQSQKGMAFDPAAQWQEELSMGATEEGTDIRTQLATGVSKGFVPIGNSQAGENASTYIFLYQNSGMDMFDSIRTCIQQIQAPISAGVEWMNEWSTASQGIIMDAGQTVLGGHCVKIAGWKTINGVPYLVVQNSWGVSYGDGGCFYFPRAVVNTAFGPYGIGYWSDNPDVQIKTLGLIQAILINIVNLYNELLGKRPLAAMVNPSFSPSINKIASAIQIQEGYIAPCLRYPFGTAAWRNNNPFNLRYSAYTASLGAIGYSPAGFARFKDYPSGFTAGCQLLKDAASGQLRAYQPTMTLSQFFAVYAPSSDGNSPTSYAANVSRNSGIALNTPISSLLT